MTEEKTMDANQYKDMMLTREQQYHAIMQIIVGIIDKDDLTKRFHQEGVTFEELLGETMQLAKDYTKLKEEHISLIHASLEAANEIGETKKSKEELYREKTFWENRCKRVEQAMMSLEKRSKEELTILKEVYIILTDAHHTIDQPFNELKKDILPKLEKIKEDNKETWDNI